MSRHNVITFLMLYVLSLSTAYGADYYITSDGNDSLDGKKKDNAWQSIDKANQSLRAGDTVFIGSGEYNDPIKPANSGNSGNYITYQAITGETPVVTAPSGKVGIPLDGRSYIKVDGLTFDGKKVYKSANITSWVTVYNSNYNIIQNSTFKYGQGWAGVEIDEGSHHNQFLNNSFFSLGDLNTEDDKGDLFMIKCAEYNLVEGNTFNRGGHNLFDVSGAYNVIRYNVFDNRWSDTRGNRSGDLSGNNKFCSSGARGYNLFEYNILHHTLGGWEDPDPGVMKVQGTNQIVRRNIYNNNGFVVFISGVRPPNITESWKLKIYHNVLYKNGWLWEMRDYSNAANTDHITFKNNIIYGNKTSPDIFANMETSSKAAGNDKTNATTIIGNAFNRSGDTKFNFVGIGTKTLDEYESSYPTYINSNIKSAPMLVSDNPEKLEDFMIQSGSPMRDAGAFLTETKGNGSGKTVAVADAGYFTDGFEVIDGDKVQIGSNAPATIVDIDYSKNTLTIDRSINWNDGDGVSLPYTGSAPDIGAFEYGLDAALSTPMPPVIRQLKQVE